MVFAKFFGSFKGISKKENEFYTVDLIADSISTDASGRAKKIMLKGAFCTKKAYADAQGMDPDSYCQVEYGINDFGQPIICGLVPLEVEEE